MNIATPYSYRYNMQIAPSKSYAYVGLTCRSPIKANNAERSYISIVVMYCQIISSQFCFCYQIRVFLFSWTYLVRQINITRHRPAIYHAFNFILNLRYWHAPSSHGRNTISMEQLLLISSVLFWKDKHNWLKFFNF